MKNLIVIVACILTVLGFCLVDAKACDVAATVPAFSMGYCSQPAAAAFAPSYAPAFAPSYATAAFAPSYVQAAPVFATPVFAAPVAVFDVGRHRRDEVIVQRRGLFGAQVTRVRH